MSGIGDLHTNSKRAASVRFPIVQGDPFPTPMIFQNERPPNAILVAPFEQLSSAYFLIPSERYLYSDSRAKLVAPNVTLCQSDPCVGVGSLFSLKGRKGTHEPSIR